jgi:hypothetical protein
MATPDAVDFLVDRRDLRRTRLAPGQHTPETPLAPGQVLARIDRFAMTANNITYGAIGDLIGYWRFFPAPDEWGRIPVWGFAEVVRSRHDGVPVGERLYGYFPMSTYLLIQADRVGPASITDASPHRAALPAIYNQYARVAADPEHDPALDGAIAIFRPLFATAFVLDQFLAGESFFGARQVILLSASSKTALGLAFLLHRDRRDQCRVIGLTSRTNAAFVRATGYYDEVRTYDEIGALAADVPGVVVDFAGNAQVLHAVHRHLGASLRYSCRVGITHWDRMGGDENLPGPAPVLFFAPDHMREGFPNRIGAAMRAFLASATWLRLVEGQGPDHLERVYRAFLDGKVDPAAGYVLSL